MSLRQWWLMCGTRSFSPGLHAWLGPGCHFLRPSRQLLGHSKAGIAHQTWLLDGAVRGVGGREWAAALTALAAWHRQRLVLLVLEGVLGRERRVRDGGHSSL